MPEEHASQGIEDLDVARFEELATLMVWRQRRRFAQSLHALGLTMPQFLAMMVIQECGGGCTMGELAEAAEQCSATMTGIVDRLLRMGLVERQRDPCDRRTVRVALTEGGRALLTQAQAGRKERAKQMLAFFTPEECAMIMRLLARYVEILGSDDPTPCP